MEYQRNPVTVSSAAFAFCRYTVAAMLWAAFFLKLRWLVAATFAILALSALLGIRRAPLVALYSFTLNRWFPSKNIELDANGMRFAHILGSVFSGACVLVLYLVDERVGWGLTFLLCILKTVSAVGLCPAYKLYGCMTSGTCCSFLRKKSP